MRLFKVNYYIFENVVIFGYNKIAVNIFLYIFKKLFQFYYIVFTERLFITFKISFFKLFSQYI